MGRRSATGMGGGSQDAYPFFQRRPTEGGGPIAYRLLRLKAADKFSGVVLSSDMIGCYTHWWGGRTQPCVGKECKACKANSETKWKGWMACLITKTAEIVITEFTHATVDEVTRFFDQHRTFKGSTVRLVRIGPRANGKLAVSFNDTRSQYTLLPECPNVPAILARMWGVDRTLPMTEGPTILVSPAPNVQPMRIPASGLESVGDRLEMPQGLPRDGQAVHSSGALYIPKKA